MLPVKVSTAFNTSASVISEIAKVWSISVSMSYEGREAPNTIVPVYSLGIPIYDSMVLVALPQQRMSKPEANGSSVPACPTLKRLIPVFCLSW